MSTDWSQFWPSVIATLIGFFLAIVFQQMVYEKIKDYCSTINRGKLQLNKIKDELNNIKKDLESSLIPKEGYVHIDPIKTPVWDGVLNMNEIPLIADFCKIKKKYCNRDLLTELLSIYSLISEYNKYNNLYAEQLSMGRDKMATKPVFDAICNTYKELYAEKNNSLGMVDAIIFEINSIVTKNKR